MFFGLLPVTDSALQLIERGMTPGQMTGSGAHLYRQIDELIAPVGRLDSYGSAVQRVQGAKTSLVVDWRKHNVYSEMPPILIFVDRGQVRAQFLPTLKNGLGWNAASFRMVGNQMFGCGSASPGNWSMPVALAMKWSGRKWKPISVQTQQDEISGIGFARRSGRDLTLDFRSYDFRILTAPHAGPLLTQRATWRWGGNRYGLGRPRLVNNALAAMDEFIEGVYRGKPETVKRIVPDPNLRATAIRYLAGLNRSTAVVCVDSYTLERGNIFGIEDSDRRGDWRGSAFFEFASKKGKWVLQKVGREFSFPHPARGRDE